MSILRKAISKITPASNNTTLTERDLINAESKLGGTLFGPVPKGHRREFFCLDEHTWVWYESITNPETNKTTTLTTRYEIRGNKILKIQDGQPHRYTTLEETKNLTTAISQYYELIKRYIYARPANA